MPKQSWLFFGGVVIVIAVLGALLWPPAPPPAPALVPAAPSATSLATSAVAAAATALPVSTSTLTPPPATAATVANATAPATPRPSATLPPLTAFGTGRIELGDGLAITLTTGWLGAPHPLPAALGFTDPNGAPLLAAWQGADTYLAAPVRMTLVRVPRAGIGLPAYLDGMGAALATATNVVITGQLITTTLRNDGLPAGVIRYTDHAAFPPLDGQQAILIDDSGEQLLLLTVTAPADQAALLDDQFAVAVASITFGE